MGSKGKKRVNKRNGEDGKKKKKLFPVKPRTRRCATDSENRIRYVVHCCSRVQRPLRADAGDTARAPRQRYPRTPPAYVVLSAPGPVRLVAMAHLLIGRAHGIFSPMTAPPSRAHSDRSETLHYSRTYEATEHVFTFQTVAKSLRRSQFLFCPRLLVSLPLPHRNSVEMSCILYRSK